MKKLLSALSIILLLAVQINADSVRGSMVAYAVAEDTVIFTAGDLIALDLNDSPTLITAYQIEISVPQAIRSLRGAYALYVYRRVSPRPSNQTTRYRGIAVDFYLLPPSSRFSVLLPLEDAYRREDAIDAITVDRTFSREDFPMLVSILPVMKGIPASAKGGAFELRLKPVFKEKGILVLDYSQDRDHFLPFELFIDEEIVSSAAGKHVLDPGFHTISLVSGHYAEKTLTVAIEKGIYSTVTVPLVPLRSLVSISAPDTAAIFLDGELVGPDSRANIAMENGEHTLLIRIGDYSLSRFFHTKPGESYVIELEMEISILSQDRGDL